jgi:hypothetical protein
VAQLGRVVVPKVLEPGEVGHLARRQERLAAEVAGQEAQSVKGDSVALGLVGQGLVDCILRLRVKNRVRVVATRDQD